MSHVTLIVDGRTEIDENVTPGQKRPPNVLADMIKPGATPKPYLMAAAAALAEAVMKNQPIHVTVETRPNGWTLTVNHVTAETFNPSMN